MDLFLYLSYPACKCHLFYAVLYWGADKSLARPTSGSILFDGENISFDASLGMCVCVCVCVCVYIYIYI